MRKDIVIPTIGEKVESGTVVAVLVSVGDRVAVDDGIVEFETEKAVVEIPSPLDGEIVEILVAKGDELRIGDVVARLETDGSAEQDDADPPDEPHRSTPATAATAEETDKEAASAGQSRDDRAVSEESPSGSDETTDFAADQPAVPAPAAPSVRRLARELGVDLQQVRGSGPGGRISDKDVRQHAAPQASRQETDRQVPLDQGRPMELPDFARWGPVEAIKMTTVRKITAESMSHAWRTIPHVTQFDRADISHVEAWLTNANKNAGKTGGKLTLTAVLMKVVARGLKKFPGFNASLDLEKQEIYLKGYINLGLAVDTERGLLVPVLRDVDQKTIHDIADEIRDLVDRARNKRIQPDEMEGGTFTVSNQGGIGGVNFTPIVYWPQAAILGVSRSAIEPRYMDETWQPRSILPLSLSYDHRLNDGADAARFLQWICHALEYPLALQ